MQWLRPFVMSLLGLPLVLAAPASSAAAADIDLSTDASGALFSAQQLSTNYQASRCIQVRWGGNAVPRVLGVAAAVKGGLAPHLALEIDAGTGGGYAGCRSFVGESIYRGTLGEFGIAHPTSVSQLTAKRVTAEAGTVTFRLKVSVVGGNEAQSLTASADFIFAALDESRLPTDPGTTLPTDMQPAVPSPSPGAVQPSTNAEDKEEEGTSVNPGTMPRRQVNLPPDEPGRQKAAPGPAVTVPLAPGPDVPAIFASPMRAMMHLVEGARQIVDEAAAPVAKGVAFGAWSLPTLLGFLLLQNYFDARDPKLAQAPVFANPSLPFDDGYGPSAAPGASR